MTGYEGNAFAFTGDATADILSITAVHPMRDDAIDAFLARAGADTELVDAASSPTVGSGAQLRRTHILRANVPTFTRANGGSMHILVTGGMGEVGRPVVDWLLGRGHNIRVLDLDVSRPIDGAECIQGTITDFETLAPVMAGMDAVVHLAAYRHPSLAPEARLFHVNTVGTFNVFRAAADAGIKRVACASSINALGYNFGITFPKGQLQYFPIDEDHPEFTTDPYSFSKQMIERIGTYFWHREGITSTFLRFPAVYDLTPDEPGILMAFVEGCYGRHF